MPHQDSDEEEEEDKKKRRSSGEKKEESEESDSDESDDDDDSEEDVKVSRKGRPRKDGREKVGYLRKARVGTGSLVLFLL